MRCVVDHEGKWLCGSPEQVPLSKAVPLSKSTPVPSKPGSAAPQTRPAEYAMPAKATQPVSTPPLQPAANTAPTPQPQKAKPPVVAKQGSRNCPIPATGKRGPIALTDRKDAALAIDADDMEIQGKNIFIYKGKVTMERADQSLLADHAVYNHKLGSFEANGNLRYKETGTELQGERLTLNTQTDSGTIDNAHYTIATTGASGDAKQIEMVSRYLNRYHNTTYTTCDPAEKSWELQAEQIEMDELEGWGSAKNAVVRFKGVPILYTPSYTFPLDERRKSGMLFPTWGYSEVGGGDFSAPYYWNISPNQDATITPRSIGRRGLSLSGNFRYLNSDNHGEIDASLLPSDDLTGKDRYQFKLNHQGDLETAQLVNPLSYQINYATLSDKQYLSDFGNNLGLSSSDTLEQTATIHYNQDRWAVSALLSDHYTVGTAAEPYRRLPQIDGSWSSESANNQLNYSVEGQFVHFDHSSNSNAERYWIKPSASYNYTLLNDAAYIKPAVSLSQSHYSLDSGSSSSMSVPHYTLESGLFFERETTTHLHTLEPKIKFNYIPDGKNSGHDFETNSDDSSEFYGKDSAPHTKVVTLSVASDLLSNSDGTKLLSTSLERSRDFRSDRTEDWNNLIGKISSEYGSHNAALKIHLDSPQSGYTPESNYTSWSNYNSWSNTLHTSYQFDNDAGQLMNLGFIQERGSKKQLDLSSAWEINHQWGLFARYNQELISSNKHRLEDLIGVSYESCCWSTNFTRRKFFTGTDSNGANEFDTTWMLVLELKGMGKLGKSSNLNQLLEESILGYKSKP